MPFLSMEKQESILQNKENNECFEIFTTKIQLSLVNGENAGTKSPVCEFINGLEDHDLKVFLGQTLIMYAFFSANHLLSGDKLLGQGGKDFFDEMTKEMSLRWKSFLESIFNEFLESDKVAYFKNINGYHLLKDAMSQLNDKECFNMNIVPSKEFLEKIKDSQKIEVLDSYISVIFFGLNVKDESSPEKLVYWETAAQNFIRRGVLKNGMGFYSKQSSVKSNFSVEHILSYLEKDKFLNESFLMWKNILEDVGQTSVFTSDNWENKGFVNGAKNYIKKNLIKSEEIVDILLNVPLRNRKYYDIKKDMYILDVSYISFLGEMFNTIKKDLNNEFWNKFDDCPSNYSLTEKEEILNVMEKVLKEVYGKRVLILNEQSLRNQNSKNKATLKMLVTDTNDEEVHHVLDSIVKYMWKNKVELKLLKDSICAVISNAQMSWDMKDICQNIKNGQKPKKF